jgi:hypothetical protein
LFCVCVLAVLRGWTETWATLPILLDKWPGLLSPSAQMAHPDPYRTVGCVCAAEVWARARAEVRIVTLRFVDPFPAQILSEVNVEGTHTAVLLQVATTKNIYRISTWKETTNKRNFTNTLLFPPWSPSLPS